MGREGAKMAMVSAAYQPPRFNWHSFSPGRRCIPSRDTCSASSKSNKGIRITNIEEKEEEGGGMRGECACIVMPFFLLFFFSLSV